MIRWVAFLSAALITTLPSGWAANPPLLSAPTVTDDGAYTTSATTLHAAWSSADMQLHVAEYVYLIRQNSPAGPIVVPWTSVGTATSMTRTGLTLRSGTTYYIGVKARYALAVESAVGYSDGITVDTESPTPRIIEPADGAIFGRQ